MANHSLTFYHGTKSQLSPGDLITPHAQENGPPLVFLTSNPDAAIWEAEITEGEGPGRVYIVEATGAPEDRTAVTGIGAPKHPWMSLCSREPLRVVREVSEWPLYHGTRVDLKPGDMIGPGYSPNYGNLDRTTKYIYFTRTLDAAIWGAELAIGDSPGSIYIVEATGPMEDDPNLTNKRFPGNPTQSFRSREPVRVIGEVAEWNGHPPEVVQAMRESLAKLDELGIEPEDD